MNNLLLRALEKCDILYDTHVVSKEHVIRAYWDFLATMAQKEERISFAFRTCSPCFEAAAIVAMLLNGFAFNTVSNDDIVASLQIGDMVLYNGQRYRWKGLQLLDGIEMMVLEQDGRGRNGLSTTWVPYNSFKHSIKPYYGVSTVTDGRGIRRPNSNREMILSKLLNKPAVEIPSVLEVSFAVVAQKQRMYDLCNNLQIRVGSNCISLVDVFPAAYYTNTGSQILIGHNPSKAMPVICFTEQLSVARDLILERGSTIVGLLVMENSYIVDNSSELDDLIGRSKPKYIHVSTIMRSDAEKRVIAQYPSASVFACTSHFLSRIDCEIKEENYFTSELHDHLSFIKHPSIETPAFENAWDLSCFRKFQSDIHIIRNAIIPPEIKDNFILSAYALMNLYSTAVFPLSWIRISINNCSINNAIKTPSQRIDDLWDLASNVQQCQDTFLDVIDLLEKQNDFFKNNSPKFDWLKNFLNAHQNEKILIVVPKAYYINILSNIFNLDDENISCTTNRRYKSNVTFDIIISLCWMPNQVFDPLQCCTAKHIVLPLYPYEQEIISYRIKLLKKVEMQLNGDIVELPNTPDFLDEDDLNVTPKQMLSSIIDMEHYINQMNSIQLQQFIKHSFSGNNTALTEVYYIGHFTNGDHIFFSKQYMAVVYSPETNSISEKPVKELSSGDILVFTRRDDYTRNIVDIIFDRLIRSDKLSQTIIDAKIKSAYWKTILREYKTENGLKHRDLALRLQDLGLAIKAVSIRQWLAEESHIVGPQKEETMEAIARLTQDQELMANTHLYFEACRTVRSTRRNILKMISDAITDRLSGNTPPAGSVLEVVYKNVDRLAETMELEYIAEDSTKSLLQIGFVNRPISDEEVST